MTTRDNAIDILKALGIIFMVYGHISTPQMHFIYLFHMAIFFIASGYLFKNSYSDDWSGVKSFIKRKIKTLYWPYVFWMCTFTLFHNLFIDINVYTNNEQFLQKVSGPYAKLTEYLSSMEILKGILKNFLMMGNEQMGNALWFLNTLFLLCVLYCVLEFYCKKLPFFESEIYQGLVSIVLLIIGYMCYLHGVSAWGGARAFSCYCLFYLGAVIKRYGIMMYMCKCPMLFVAFAFASLLLINPFYDIELARNQYTNPVVLIIASTLGWIVVYGIAAQIEKKNMFARILCIIGKNTMPIIILHFLAMKLVTGVGLLIFNEPVYCLAAFTTYYQGYGWWIAYTIIGVGAPLLLNYCYKMTWAKCKQLKLVTSKGR
ncbi:MAG: acyltransferase family protein [Butyrivibrio sp.]|nr:acyltransferase family protein [Butyrivibrio sp.]